MRRVAGTAAVGIFAGAVLAACAGSHVDGEQAAPMAASGGTAMVACERKRFYTAADDGCRIEMAPGHSAQLLVRDMQAPEPRLQGDAVELIAVADIQGQGRRAWEIRARAPGTSHIVVAGSRPFSLTIVVRDD